MRSIRTAVPLVVPLLLAAGLTACPKSEEAVKPKVEAPAPAKAEAQAKPQAALVSRDVLFGNPDRASVRVSPDGARMSFLAPVGGVLNVWVAPVDAPDAAKAVTKDTGRGIRQYAWAYDGAHLIYLQDQGGDENWRLHSVDLSTLEDTDLTPMKGVQARIVGMSRHFPSTLLVGLNDRNPALHDVWKVDLKTGRRSLVLQNPGFAGFLVDEQLRVRLGTRQTPDGGMLVMRAKTPASAEAPAPARAKPGDFAGWETFLEVPQVDAMTTQPLFFDDAGTTLYLMDSRDRNTAAAFAWDLESGERRLLAQDPRADVTDFLAHPTKLTLQAAAFDYLRKTWTVLDPEIAGDLEALHGVAEGEVEVTSRSLDDQTWIVAFLSDQSPVRYYRYDRPSKQATFLFTNRKDLEDVKLVPMQPLVIPARDELSLVSYLTLPPGSDANDDGRPDAPVPMVLFVHGGPWGRDVWGLNPVHQWLANRGYAVLSVNFRGSTGFGKAFVNAGDKEWGRKMHDDLVDAVKWAVDQRIADPDKVAIMGGSYGGYATLVGLTFTPTTFACGVDIVGPSNLLTLLESIPPYWKPLLDTFASRVGDPRTEEGKALLESRSPLNRVDAIERPLLIGQGANDPRVKQAESDRIVAAMQKKDIPVTYVLFPDEGHGFARPPNRIAFFAVSEAFLSKCLGGRYEPVGRDFQGSSITVPDGAGLVPGLADALGTHAPATPAQGPQGEGTP